MECRDIGDKEMWGNVERECQRGLVIGGLSCDRWGAQRRLSCNITVSYNVEYVESGCRKGVYTRPRTGKRKSSN